MKGIKAFLSMFRKTKGKEREKDSEEKEYNVYMDWEKGRKKEVKFRFLPGDVCYIVSKTKTVELSRVYAVEISGDREREHTYHVVKPDGCFESVPEIHALNTEEEACCQAELSRKAHKRIDDELRYLAHKNGKSSAFDEFLEEIGAAAADEREKNVKNFDRKPYTVEAQRLAEMAIRHYEQTKDEGVVSEDATFIIAPLDRDIVLMLVKAGRVDALREYMIDAYINFLWPGDPDFPVIDDEISSPGKWIYHQKFERFLCRTKPGEKADYEELRKYAGEGYTRRVGWRIVPERH